MSKAEARSAPNCTSPHSETERECTCRGYVCERESGNEWTLKVTVKMKTKGNESESGNTVRELVGVEAERVKVYKSTMIYV